jgi:hypothetical protein
MRYVATKAESLLNIKSPRERQNLHRNTVIAEDIQASANKM